ncbi:MAG: HDOD domain-containing protein [Pseudomonadota bacterium]|nr:HDOD domain-containing protein [Pseudomonadota bacterium]
MARQPIFDAGLEVAAYQLLHAEAADGSGPPDHAAAQLFTSALDIGFRRLVGDAPAFIRFPTHILGQLQLPLSPERIVIEVSGASATDGRLVDGLMRLRGEGYRIALADFDLWQQGVEILDYADTVKVDVRRHSAAQLASLVPGLRRYRVQIVAEGVETAGALARCRELGFDFFQGNFLEHPEAFAGRAAPGSRLVALELVHTLQDCSVPAGEIESSIVRDVALSYRLLRCINSSYYRMPRVVNSMLHAILLLGYDEVRRICAVVLLASMNDRPAYVAIQALTRARMCENLCVAAGAGAKGAYFMSGLLSLVDVILGAPLQECLEELPLDDAVRNALCGGQGPMGAALHCVIAHERGDWAAATFEALSGASIASAYSQAVEWAECMHAALRQ